MRFVLGLRSRADPGADLEVDVSSPRRGRYGSSLGGVPRTLEIVAAKLVVELVKRTEAHVEALFASHHGFESEVGGARCFG